MKTYFYNTLSPFYSEQAIKELFFLIIQHVTKKTLSEILIAPNYGLTPKEEEKIKKITRRLSLSEPIEYILKETQFRNLSLHLNNFTLIPRPETSELIDWINEENNKNTILDIGTGSGCIALSLAKENPTSKIFACDISKEALKIAKKNAKKHNLNINFFWANILDEQIFSHKKKYDIIVSNPPYICQKEAILMNDNVLKYEPHSALFVPDEDPLLFYREISKFAISHLNEHGRLFFEINENYAQETKQIIQSIGFKNIEIKKDFYNKNRMIKACIK